MCVCVCVWYNWTLYEQQYEVLVGTLGVRNLCIHMYMYVAHCMVLRKLSVDYMDSSCLVAAIVVICHSHNMPACKLSNVFL